MVTTVFVQNPNGTPITLDVTYYFSDEAQDLGVLAGVRPLSSLPGTPRSRLTRDAVQLDATYGPSRYIQRLRDDDSGRRDGHLQNECVLRVFAGRETVRSHRAGNGFSLEGFPVGNFSSATAASSDCGALLRRRTTCRTASSTRSASRSITRSFCARARRGAARHLPAVRPALALWRHITRHASTTSFSCRINVW